MRLLMDNSMAIMVSFGDVMAMRRSMPMLNSLMTSLISDDQCKEDGKSNEEDLESVIN